MNENEFLAKQLVEWTNQMNSSQGKASKAIKTAFPYLYRRYEYLKTTKILCSEKACDLVKNVFGNFDLRNYDWYSKLPLKATGKKVLIRSYLTWDHYNTAKEFKYKLQRMYDTNQLSRKNIEAELLKQSMCWILPDEHVRLRKAGFNSTRPDPVKAYEEVGIKIAENC